MINQFEGHIATSYINQINDSCHPEINVKNINENFICPILKGINSNKLLGFITKIYIVECCKKIYCHGCIHKWVTEKKSCPNCKKNVTTDQIIL